MAVVLRCLGAFIQSMASCAMYEAGRASAGVSECPPHALVTRVGEVVGEGGVEKRGGVGGCCLFPSISGMVTMLRAPFAQHGCYTDDDARAYIKEMRRKRRYASGLEVLADGY